VAALTGSFAPAALAVAPMASPRMVGEAAYALGRGTGAAQRLAAPASRAMQSLRQAGTPGVGADILRTSPLVILANQAGQR
jgi:hypothetical protein